MIKKKQKMLFIGFNHQWNDPRLYYREILILKDTFPDLEIYILGPLKINKNDNHATDKVNIVEYVDTAEKFKNKILKLILSISIIKKIKKRIYYLQISRQIKPDVVQASDIREISFAFVIKLFTGARLIYDSHEDYYQQIVEAENYTLRGKISAIKFLFKEVFLLRFFNAIYCTDEYLLNKYSSAYFANSNVFLMRNFPNTKIINNRCTYLPKVKLEILYIGGVNEKRGIIESVDYISKFNDEFNGIYDLNLTMFSPDHEIIKNIKHLKFVKHHPYIDYLSLLEKMVKFDVGLCLWLRTKKFERNLPLKNFDYMSLGLPVLTSNFGNLKKYIEHSKAGYCINPLDYSEFKAAILDLLNAERREFFGQNGLNYVKSKASFERESKAYIKTINRLIYR